MLDDGYYIIHSVLNFLTSISVDDNGLLQFKKYNDKSEDQIFRVLVDNSRANIYMKKVQGILMMTEKGEIVKYITTENIACTLEYAGENNVYYIRFEDKTISILNKSFDAFGGFTAEGYYVIMSDASKSNSQKWYFEKVRDIKYNTIQPVMETHKNKLFTDDVFKNFYFRNTGKEIPSNYITYYSDNINEESICLGCGLYKNINSFYSNFKMKDCKLLRGRKSRQLINREDIPIGDPYLISSLIYKPKTNSKLYKIGYISNKDSPIIANDSLYTNIIMSNKDSLSHDKSIKDNKDGLAYCESITDSKDSLSHDKSIKDNKDSLAHDKSITDIKDSLLHNDSIIDNKDVFHKIEISDIINVEKLIDDICECECLLTEELVPMIIAHSYGIPAIRYRLDHELSFEFLDYYSCFENEIKEHTPFKNEIKSMWVPKDIENLKRSIKAIFDSI